MKRIAAVLFALSLAVAAPVAARAADISDSDRAAIQSVINDQIHAFQRDDGATAYADASPTIQSIFTTPDAFMAMVKNGYQPVYRPQALTFGDIVDSEAGPLQKVFVTGPDGQSYLAVYTLQRQPDGSWKINGCSLVDNDSPSI